MRKVMSHRLLVALVLALLATACGGDDGGGADDSGTDATATEEEAAAAEATEEGDAGDGEEIELTFAHSYDTGHPHHECGAQLVADRLAEEDVGLTVSIYPNSQLGGDADRTSSVLSGDIDLDLQGVSAISASYPPIGVLDAAFGFDDADHMFAFIDSDRFEELQQDILDEVGLRIVDSFYFGMRHFTANQPIRTPDDFAGLRMRFPDTPQYLANAEAMGADATAVAFEEVYLSLQQGIIDGQENPLPNIDSLNLPEVQSHLSLTGHMTGFTLVIMPDSTWQRMSPEQQDVLTSVIREVREENRECVAGEEERLLQEWRDAGTIEIVEDVDREAFAQKAEEYFTSNLQGDDLELYNAVRETAS